MKRGNLRSIALRSLIVSVVATALLGIVAVLANQFNDTTVRVLMTSLVVSVASLATLTCAALLERGDGRPLALAGIVLSVVGAALIIVGIWARINSEPYWRTTGSISVVGVLSAHICLLWLARLAPRFDWVRLASLVTIYALAGVIVWMIVGDPPEQVIWRPLAVLGILAAAVTIVVPVLQKLSGPANAGAPVTIRMECPDCGERLSASAGAVDCAGCGCRLEVAVLRRGRIEARPAPPAELDPTSDETQRAMST